MEHITFSNSQFYSPAEVLISVREPFNKNTLWLHTHDGIIELKIFDKGWKSIYSTQDNGLSKTSIEQVSTLIKELQENINNKLKKQLGKYSSDSITLLKRQKELEEKISILESKFEKLHK